jgi:hypothetical protein
MKCMRYAYASGSFAPCAARCSVAALLVSVRQCASVRSSERQYALPVAAALWRGGTAALRRCGAAALRRGGASALRRCGGVVALWRCGVALQCACVVRCGVAATLVRVSTRCPLPVAVEPIQLLMVYVAYRSFTPMLYPVNCSAARLENGNRRGRRK